MFFVLILSVPSNAQISISLRNTSNWFTSFEEYHSTGFFKSQYANTHRSMEGYLHQPEPRNGCSHIQPLGDENSWIAVIEDYPNCVVDMVTFVKNAGYSLILASSPNDSNTHLTNEVRNLGFPIVLITEEYSDYLVQEGLSDFDNPDVLATVKTAMDVTIAITAFIAILVFLCACCLCCVCCCGYLVRRRRRRFASEVRTLEERHRNYNRFQNRDRIAREELIESILRQLQQLQLEGQQRPLGTEATKKLPIETYKKLVSSSQEACAICVDDFKDADRMRVLPCNHHFHMECIDEWLINHSDLCPLCKKQVPNGSSTSSSPARGGRGRGQGRGRGNLRRARGNLHEDLVLFREEDTTESDSPPNRPQERLLPSRINERYGST